ncbi:hypothetical protein [Polaribacter sp. Hel_I_88]|uniref:hypothetical protein n=1 Tax=Polaribacter sp. Hel_I_88 TaxID=1250006 RepID=UPI00068C43F1|nr:hypothetical protein [Polaribacter sp. Hel_I_88]
MKINLKLLGGMLFMLPLTMAAQSPISGFMKAKGEGSITVTQSREDYNDVFLVPNKVNSVPVFNEVTTKSVSLYAEYGFSDRLNFVVSLPYIQTTGEATPATLANNGFENERSGFQDVSIYAKYKIKSYEVMSGNLDIIGALGVETPLGNYNVDEGLQSIIAIGNRSTDITGLAIANYKHNSGVFAIGQVGYSLRSNEVPNALISQLKIGYAASVIYGDIYIANQLSGSDGVDILGEGFTGFFPATRVNYTRIGANMFVPVVKGFGLTAGINTYISGRNLGDSTGAYSGLSFSF